MLGCSVVCPNCKHEFQCCPPNQQCCSTRRSLHVLSGGGLVTTLAPNPSPCPSPQVSPSVPLSFILPPFATPLQFAPAPLENNSETELQRLSDTVRALRLSGWYYEGITYQQSHELLKGTSVGKFLVRNSSDPKFLFSLSVQTERGPTSVRLFYTNGYFRLDAQVHLQSAMPMFPSVIDLIQHYVQQSKLCRNNAQVWVDQQGKWYSSILLEKPVRKKSKPPSLKHLARLATHKALQDAAKPRLAMLPRPHTQLELPNSLIGYLSEYPFYI
ncbi:suppressor of cytokine signaling 2-like [Diorhabda sublineata]|uniref:suppressor of cytokine signaling 2-like n=1 Tax=Diorhabda sublineata TaxID=1163346 RepID=UPI0024E1942A|nr:suppressor of cytokine signaling 2-like [Diorhabda sublineata]